MWVINQNILFLKFSYMQKEIHKKNKISILSKYIFSIVKIILKFTNHVKFPK